eukprot:2254075-Ditylum_brightwellii.AAC.1
MPHIEGDNDQNHQHEDYGGMYIWWLEFRAGKYREQKVERVERDTRKERETQDVCSAIHLAPSGS